MTATTVEFSPKVASDWDPQKPLTTTKLNKLFDNTTNLHERLGGSFTSNTIDHTHNGLDSALVPVGPNFLRNGSFEDGLAGWDPTPYPYGTVASSNTNFNGAKSLAITSTVQPNGGGYVLSSEFIPVTGGNAYSVYAAIMSGGAVANVSSKIEIVWYNSAKALISASAIYSSSNTPIVQSDVGGALTAPLTARFIRVRLTGGVPATGTNVGTIYFDGVRLTFAKLVAPGELLMMTSAYVYNYPGAFPTKTKEMRIGYAGQYRVKFDLASDAGAIHYGQIYKNGVAYGTLRGPFNGVPRATHSEDLLFNEGDLCQLYVGNNSGGVSTTGRQLSLYEAYPLDLRLLLDN